jgi:hypothetical protein
MRTQPVVPVQPIMSYLIVLCVAAVEALNLVVLWIALRVSIPRVARPFVACCGLSLAWGAWVLMLVLRGPLWMMALTGSMLALSSVAMGLAIHLAILEEEGRHDGGAGVAPTVGPEAPGGGGNDEPLWWPEFQRQVAAYAARRDRERQPVA